MSEDTVTLHVLWGRIDGNPYPQFVAAFSDGEVECWPEMYERRRSEAEAFARGFGDDVWAEFWTTVATLPRPPVGAAPSPEALALASALYHVGRVLPLRRHGDTGGRLLSDDEDPIVGGGS